MKAKLVLLTLLSTFSLPPSALLGQGILTPPGAPAPTMKTLAQIEPRTPISSAPFTITGPGSYYLTTNLTVSGGDAVTIATNGVTLDLNGFTIASTTPSATGCGIAINYGLRNLTILNGYIQGGVTNNGSGVYSGSGFGFGLYGFSQNARVSGVAVSGCLYLGIYLGNADSTVVESCTVRTVGSVGIAASTVKASVARDCGDSAILSFQVADSRGESTSGHGVVANTALNCYGQSSSGTGLNAYTAENCQGVSTSGVGLNANTALNGYGTSSSGTGLNANTALNCQGASSTDVGLNATMAQNCQGTSPYIGLYATAAQNSYGSCSGSGVGLFAKVAIGCYGATASGIGLEVIIANSCIGSTSGGGTPLMFTYKCNMP